VIGKENGKERKGCEKKKKNKEDEGGKRKERGHKIMLICRLKSYETQLPKDTRQFTAMFELGI